MEFIDGKPVISHRVRFRGRAEITEHEAQHVRDGNTVMWLVKTRCLPPQYHPTTKDADERYRFNIQDVVTVTPLAGDLREQAVVYLDHGPDQTYCSERHGETRLPFENGFSMDNDTVVKELIGFLDEIGELHEGEDLADAVRRLFEGRLAVVRSESDPQCCSLWPDRHGECNQARPLSRLAFAEAGGE